VWRLPVLVVVAFVCVVARASAARVATDAERIAIADALAVPEDCASVRVSTVDGSFALLRRRDASGCDEAVGAGFFVFQSGAAGWTQVSHGTDEFAPCAISEPVGRDLGICKQRRVYVLCANRRATARHRSFKPRRCNTLGPRQPFAAAVNLARLRWTGWGAEVATARGVELGFRLREADIPVRVRAYGRRLGCRGDWVYTRLRVSSRYGRTVVRLPTRCP
jgi:hypothetical protein